MHPTIPQELHTILDHHHFPHPRTITNTTHNIVITDNTRSTYAKCFTHNYHDIQLEHHYHTRYTGKAQYHHHEPWKILIMDTAGTPITPTVWTQNAEHIAEHLHTIHSDPQIPPHTPPTFDPEQLHHKMIQRLTGAHSAITTWYDHMITETLPHMEPLKGTTLTHGDIHHNNWLHNGEHLVLIDWESVMTSVPERDLASFVYAAARAHVPYDHFLKAYGTYDENILRDALRCKLLTAATHKYSTLGEKEFWIFVESPEIQNLAYSYDIDMSC